MPEGCLVVFTPSGRRGRFAIGTPVRDAAIALNVDLDSTCGGVGLCGRCQVEVGEGRLKKYGIISGSPHLSPLSEPEKRYDRRHKLPAGRRLACQARIEGDLLVNIRSEFQVHRPVIRKDAIHREIILDCDLRACFIEVPTSDHKDRRSDAERVAAALKEKWETSDPKINSLENEFIASALRAGDGAITAIIRRNHEVIDVRSGFQPEIYGIAVDIGSTTIALQLIDLSTGEVRAAIGVMNPQIRFGEDIMSRLSYLLGNSDGSGQLTRCVRQAINDMIAKAAAEVGIDARLICEGVVVGNPVMHHLFFGLDASGLATAPFTLATPNAITVGAADLGLTALPAAEIYAPPCFGAHVGADTAAAVLAEQPHKGGAMRMLIDVGTNAEIVLSDGKRVLAASSPTGPAFEGAQISSGQRAAMGAIERVRIDPDTLEPRLKIIGCDLWSDEDSFVDANVFITGICGSGIVEAMVELARAGILREDGVILQEASKRTWRVIPDGPVWSYVLHKKNEREIRITQQDVRAIQLAKSALKAGALLLMDRLGCKRVDEICLAGGFGSQIDSEYALALGMIPMCEKEKVKAVGNAAGVGARIALLNQKSRTELVQLARRVEKIETVSEPAFQHHFVESMSIPAAIIGVTERTRTGRRGQKPLKGRK